jgi:hypothetical protein
MTISWAKFASANRPLEVVPDVWTMVSDWQFQQDFMLSLGDLVGVGRRAGGKTGRPEEAVMRRSDELPTRPIVLACKEST